MSLRTLASVALLVSMATIATADVRVRHLFSTGPAPGLPEDVFAQTIFGPANPILTNSDGQTLVIARLTGTGVTPDNEFALWLVEPGRAELLLREGDAIDGFPDAVVGFFEGLGMSDDNTVFLRIALDGLVPVGANTALAYVRPGEAPVVLAVEGDEIPGRPGEFWGDWGRAIGASSRDGEFVFRMTTSALGTLAFATTAGVTPIYFVGDPIPDVPGATGAIDGIGAVANGPIVHFMTRLSGPGLTTANDQALYEYRDGAMNLLAREGDPVPGLTDVFFGRLNSFGLPNTDGFGAMSFGAALTGAGAPPSNPFGLFMADANGVRPLMLNNDPLPGLPAGTTLFNLAWPAWSPGGAAFFAQDTDGGARGLWRVADAGPENIARQGDTPPDNAPPFMFVNFPPFGNYGPVRYSRTGRLGFHGLHDDPMTDLPTVYGDDPLGSLRRGLGGGDTVQTPTGDHTVGFVSDIRLTDDGGIVALATLADVPGGSGLFRLDIGCPGSGCDDIDIAGSDCVVDLSDLAQLLADFGSAGRGLPGDIDRNGLVDLADLAALLAGFGLDCR